MWGGKASKAVRAGQDRQGHHSLVGTGRQAGVWGGKASKAVRAGQDRQGYYRVTAGRTAQSSPP